jgi:hypothetical protein
MKLFLIFIPYFLVIFKPLSAQSQTLVPFMDNERWGFKNEKNEVVVKNIFFQTLAFNDHGIAAVIDDIKVFLLKLNTKTIDWKNLKLQNVFYGSVIIMLIFPYIMPVIHIHEIQIEYHIKTLHMYPSVNTQV